MKKDAITLLAGMLANPRALELTDERLCARAVGLADQMSESVYDYATALSTDGEDEAL